MKIITDSTQKCLRYAERYHLSVFSIRKIDPTHYALEWDEHRKTGSELEYKRGFSDALMNHPDSAKLR